MPACVHTHLPTWVLGKMRLTRTRSARGMSLRSDCFDWLMGLGSSVQSGSVWVYDRVGTWWPRAAEQTEHTGKQTRRRGGRLEPIGPSIIQVEPTRTMMAGLRDGCYGCAGAACVRGMAHAVLMVRRRYCCAIRIREMIERWWDRDRSRGGPASRCRRGPPCPRRVSIVGGMPPPPSIDPNPWPGPWASRASLAFQKAGRMHDRQPLAERGAEARLLLASSWLHSSAWTGSAIQGGEARSFSNASVLHFGAKQATGPLSHPCIIIQTRNQPLTFPALVTYLAYPPPHPITSQ